MSWTAIYIIADFFGAVAVVSFDVRSRDGDVIVEFFVVLFVVLLVVLFLWVIFRSCVFFY